MTKVTTSPPRRAPRALASVLVLLLVSACGSSSPTPAGSDALSSPRLFDSSVVHDISISFDGAAYEAMIAAYTSSRAKEWIEATVTVDGATYEGAGLRLKGNSSLMGLAGGRGMPGGGANVSSENPQSLPWLVDLDQFVDGQQHQGITEFVVRSNSSTTALNEAVALELLERAGLASQDAIATRFRVNGGDEVLRLVIENPDDGWMSETLGATGALYKAESSGDYSYRGESPDAYDEVFDQEAGKDNADLTPLIEFLRFINESDDATFAAEIKTHLDVESFATYLAMQELLANFDDIDGPGNNSYLYYDVPNGQFTVVPWDYNLAFGTGFGGREGGAGGFEPPEGFQPPAGGRQGGPGGGGFGARSNVLSERFLEIEEYQTLVEAKTDELRAQLLDGGVAADILSTWVSVLKAQGGDLVTSETIKSEADRIAAYF